MIKEIEITPELLKVLPLLKVRHTEKEFIRDVVDDETGGVKEETHIQQILYMDSDDLFLSEDIVNDIAFALDLAMKNSPDTDGERRYSNDDYDKILSLAKYVVDHLYDLVTIMVQFSGEGLKSGVYRCKDSEMIWKKVS